MKFLMNHGEKLVCSVVVILCAVWIVQTLRSNAAEKLGQIRENEAAIKAALDSNTASESYEYHPSKVASFSDEVKDRINGAENSVSGPLVSRAFYPQPERPVVEETKKVVVTVETQEAMLPQYKGLAIEAQHGMVVVNCVQPDKLLNFVPVRIEIQRGPSPDKLNTKIHAFELAPEVAVVKTDDPAKKADTPAVDSGEEKSGTTARSIRRQPTPKTGKSGKDDKSKVKPPSRFEDLGVASETTYYYRARIVARLETMGPNNMVFRDGKEVNITVPDSVEKVPGGAEGVTLYASPWSAVEKATVPANYELRFNFVTGTVPSDPRSPQVGYSAHLGVRLWDTEARAWGESSFEVPAGQPVRGKLKFKVGTATKLLEFDTGLVFDSVRNATRFEVETVKEPLMETKTDENGATVPVPVVDEAGQPKWVVKVVPRRSPTQIAVLRVGETDKQVRLLKGLRYEDKLSADVKILLEGEPEPDIEQLQKAAAAALEKPGTAPANPQKPKAGDATKPAVAPAVPKATETPKPATAPAAPKAAETTKPATK